jgi:hypothetical protein
VAVWAGRSVNRIYLSSRNSKIHICRRYRTEPCRSDSQSNCFAILYLPFEGARTTVRTTGCVGRRKR